MKREAIVDVMSNILFRSGQVTTGACDELAGVLLFAIEDLEIMKPGLYAESAPVKCGSCGYTGGPKEATC